MTPPPKTPVLARHPLRTGVLFWSLFSVLAVVIRGVRWDENYEFAQVILGQIPFPEDHPLNQYVWRLFSLQPFGLAALMHFLPGPLWANALRNVLFLMASTIPIYLWGTLLSRRPLVGHASVVLVLTGIHVTFYSSYPIHVWPSIFSNGPIGLGYMLLALWAIASKRHRAAGLLVGFAPLIHLGQFPPLLATSVLYVCWNLYVRRVHAVRQFALALLPGILVMIAFGLFLRYFGVPIPTEGPYFSDTDPMTLWHHYMAHYATHRAIPYSTGHLVFFGAVALAVPLFVLQLLRQRVTPVKFAILFDAPAIWVGVYLAITICTVWVIMAIHYVMGADIPFVFAGWLPYRLMNHVAPLLIPLLLAIGFRRDQRTPLWLPPLLIAALLGPLLHLALPSDVVNRYFMSGSYLFFLLHGAAIGSLLIAIGRLHRLGALYTGIGLLLAWMVLAWFHQFGAACVLVGIALGMIPVLPRLSSHMLHSATACIVGMTLFAMVAKDFERRDHLYRTPDMRIMAKYLDDAGDGDAMILVPDQQVGLQMKLGHPVMTDMITLLICAYQPKIAPSINALFQDFYGIYLDPASPAPDQGLAWHEVWPKKTPEEWQRLAAKYDVYYVIAPSFMNLPLERLVNGREINLFKIPKVALPTE